MERLLRRMIARANEKQIEYILNEPDISSFPGVSEAAKVRYERLKYQSRARRDFSVILISLIAAISPVIVSAFDRFL